MKVIVISAHPDDETLGAGGTLLKHKANGDEIYWLIVTQVYEKNGFTSERVASRHEEIERVGNMYGFTKVFQLDYPTMTLTGNNLLTMVPDISKVFNEVEPEIIYTVNRSDIHSDHRILSDAVFACTKSFRYPFIKRVLMYECLSETEFSPALPENVFIANYFVDITGYLDRKLEIMEVFESEIAPPPFPRSLENIKALATFRGCSIGVLHAEAFHLVKYIDKA